MCFYKNSLGGELRLITVGESPLAGEPPMQMQQCILHATLTHDRLTLAGTDIVGEEGLRRGNAVSILAECGSKDEMLIYYKNLSEGSDLVYPVKRTYWGAWFGSLTDRYGNHWLFSAGNAA